MLSNKLRTFIGMKPIDESWRKIPLKGMDYAHIYISNKSILKKMIVSDGKSPFYREIDYDIEYKNDNYIIGKKGRNQKVSYSVLSKIKPLDKSVFINSVEITLKNHANKVVLIQDYDQDFENLNEAFIYLENRLKNLNEIEEIKLVDFAKSKKVKKQKYKHGDIFRLDANEGKFIYGRIISGLRKSLEYQLPIKNEQKFDWKENHIFTVYAYYPIWVDYYNTISQNPYLKLKELTKFETTPSVLLDEYFISHSQFKIIDNAEIDLNTFDVPMDIQTKYHRSPLCHIFKWGLGVLTFKPSIKIEELLKLRIPMNYEPMYSYTKQGIEYFVNSGIKGEIDFRANTSKGDIREYQFRELRKLISKNLGFDIDERSYDEFAKEFGFMTKSEIIEFNS